MTDLVRNEALFDKIAAQIEETPDRYDQRVYAIETECGTAHCVAGWACALSKVSMVNINPDVEACRLLGLPPRDGWIFRPTWMEGRPVVEVADALRAIGRGAPVKDYL